MATFINVYERQYYLTNLNNNAKHMIEKRRFPRIFFEPNERINGIFSTDTLDDISFTASILNISLGGIQFNQKRQEYRGQQPEDTLVLRRVIGMSDLVTLTDIPLQIKWIMDNNYLDHVVMGAAFLSLHDPQYRVLKSYIDTCLALHKYDSGQ